MLCRQHGNWLGPHRAVRVSVWNMLPNISCRATGRKWEGERQHQTCWVQSGGNRQVTLWTPGQKEAFWGSVCECVHVRMWTGERQGQPKRWTGTEVTREDAWNLTLNHLWCAVWLSQVLPSFFVPLSLLGKMRVEIRQALKSFLALISYFGPTQAFGMCWRFHRDPEIHPPNLCGPGSLS